MSCLNCKYGGCMCKCTVGENIIATIKIRNNFCYPLKMIIFPILRQQYWTFLYCFLFSYRSSNFAIAKVVALQFLLQFLYKFCILAHGFFSVLLPIYLSLLQLLRQQQLSLFSILTAIFSLLLLRARKSDNYRESWKNDNFRQRAIKKEAKN